MEPLRNKPDLTGLSPFQAIQTARLHHMTLPDGLTAQLKEAEREAQLYQLKCKMKPYYGDHLKSERTPMVARVKNLTDEWHYALQKNVQEMSENNQGKAVQTLVNKGKRLSEKENLQELQAAPKSISSKDVPIGVPSHPLLPLI